MKIIRAISLTLAFLTPVAAFATPPSHLAACACDDCSGCDDCDDCPCC